MPQPQNTDLFTRIRALRDRDERRLRAGDTEVETLLLLAKVSEEAGESVEKYRRSRGWGTDGVTNASATDVSDEVCATIMAGLVALDRICPNASAHWERYLAYGYERAARENADVALES
ncbi:hypothetical protein F9278_34335 [Streptomyces phaeolivaceus]|uniref:NTP pyrophosphohydrolase MazG putative catalytic core domain-containing protein n=1 Tax=Streptomyces phaeolivaceus TaxID=2653200 RepID=A0A5P8KAS1_9ACTN|nr:hypothetical protein [Streptomyces phaeolivaceus]QFR00414.1 hypothetical protein F9278_34335 [Streptomyces phaeolivaceus]